MALEACPEAVQAAVARAAAGGAVRKIRRITADGAVSYVARIEVAFDGKGNPLPPPAAPAESTSAAADPAAEAAAALERPVTLRVAGVRLGEVCSLLTEAARVPVSCGTAFAGRLVTLTMEERPLREVLETVAQQTDTRFEPRAGGFRFRARTTASTQDRRKN